MRSILLIWLIGVWMPEVKGWCFKLSFQIDNKVRCLDYSDDGTLLVVGSESQYIYLYDTYNWIKVGSYRWNGEKPNSVKFSPDGLYIAIGYDDDDIKILNSPTMTLNKTLDTSHSKVHEVDFSYDSTKLLTCGDDKKFRVWATSGWSQIAEESHSKKVYTCKFSSDDYVGVGQENGEVVVYRNDLTTEDYDVDYGGDDVLDIDFRHGTHKYIVAYENDRGYASPSTSSIINTGQKVNTASYSRTLEYFVFAGDSDDVYIFNATNENNTLVMQFKEPAANVEASRFTNDGEYLAIGSEDFSVYIYSRQCIMCQSGQYYNSTTLQCTNCAVQITGCSICLSSTVCVGCIQGYYLNTGDDLCYECIDALASCSICASATQCLFCLPGTYLKNDDTCEACSVVMDGCLACSASNDCLECHNGYFLNGSSLCQECGSISGCLRCNSSSSCLECQMGYYVNGTNECQSCSPDCIVCSSSSDCIVCVAGYYSASGTCTQCSTNCLICDENNLCLDCGVGYYVDGGGACQECVAPCLTCNSSTYCLECDANYYSDGSGGCSACPSACSTCNQSAVCWSCVVGYYLVSDSCQICSDAHPYCESCNSSDCFVCLGGYYMNSGSCQSCNVMHACLRCSDSSTCLQCGPAYYLTALTGNDSCAACPAGCASCPNSTHCLACMPHYFLNGSSVCQPCENYCLTCTASNVCLSCGLDRYLDSTTCQPCASSISNCVACVDDTVVQCVDCAVGYYLDSNACVACSSNCVSCDDTDCFSCELGYFLDGTACTSCQPDCAECSASAVCDACNVGYYLQTTTCTPCPSLGCLTCDESLACLSCLVGYYLDTNDECQLCLGAMSNCMVCQDHNVCSMCSYGYTLAANNQSCQACSSVIDGCRACDDGDCLSCEDGYYLDSGSCSVCPQGCSSCTSTDCLECQAGFLLDSNSCQLCALTLPSCQMCSNSSACQYCLNGYYLDSGDCSLCRESMMGCSFCDDSSTCTHCQDGYYLDSTSCLACSSIEGCQLCDAGPVCNQCENGYYLSSGACALCVGSLPGCLYCSDVSTCLECKSGYYESAGQCSLCSSQLQGCIFCSSSSVCLQCEGGYYLDSSNQCVACSMQGCEICLQSNSSACVTCNSKYFYESGECTLCRDVINSCVQCTDNQTCSQCDVGYYLENATTCSLCSSAMNGCSKCQSSSSCLQCKSLYFLNGSGQCQVCSELMGGCSYCDSSSTCLACQSGFFMNGSQCEPCTSLAGCLMCQDNETCLFCESDYYLQAYECHACSVIDGCYSCLSPTICTSCLGGYTLTTESVCQEAKVEAQDDVTQLTLKTFFIDADNLRHELYAKGMSYVHKDIKWEDNVHLYIQSNDGEQIALRIKNVEWGTNDYTLIFYTDNKAGIDEDSINYMQFARRRLSESSLDTGFRVGIQISEEVMQEILPTFQHAGDLSLDYSLDSPEFYASYVQTIDTFYFYIIGTVIVGVMFIGYGGKVIWAEKHNGDYGQIIPHILCMKTGALLLFPVQVEYINYAKGFMVADFPWLNSYFGAALSQESDYSPLPYQLHYINMNIASQYLLALTVIVLLGFLGWLIGKSCNSEEKTKNYFSFLYCFFALGLTMAGAASLQGAILNPIQQLDVNGTFYILGIILYFLMVLQCFYALVFLGFATYVYKLRLIIKASLLSFGHISPLYMLAAAVTIDTIIVILQYIFSRHKQSSAETHPKLWLFTNILCNASLVLLVYVNVKIISFVFVSLFLVIVLIVQLCRHLGVGQDAAVSPKIVDEDENMWNVDMDFVEKNVTGTLASFNRQKEQKDPARKKRTKKYKQSKENQLKIQEKAQSTQEVDTYEFNFDSP